MQLIAQFCVAQLNTIKQSKGPQQIDSLLTPFENVTAAQIKSAVAQYLVPANRTAIDRVPEKKGTNQENHPRINNTYACTCSYFGEVTIYDAGGNIVNKPLHRLSGSV